MRSFSAMLGTFMIATTLACGGRTGDEKRLPSDAAADGDAASASTQACPYGAVGVANGERCIVDGVVCVYPCHSMTGSLASLERTAACSGGTWHITHEDTCPEFY